MTRAWLTREVGPALGFAAGLACLVFATEVRHQARWHPNGIGRARCEEGYCASRGSARARWGRRLGLASREGWGRAVPVRVVVSHRWGPAERGADQSGYRSRGSQRLDAVLD